MIDNLYYSTTIINYATYKDINFVTYSFYIHFKSLEKKEGGETTRLYKRMNKKNMLEYSLLQIVNIFSFLFCYRTEQQKKMTNFLSFCRHNERPTDVTSKGQCGHACNLSFLLLNK
jgi:hypothetical protein